MSKPFWSEKVLLNSRPFTRVEEMDDQSIILCSDYFSIGGGIGRNLLTLDEEGNFLWAFNHNNQLGDSAIDVVNSGDEGTILFAGSRKAANGGGVSVESFDYVNSEDVWTKNYFCADFVNCQLRLAKIWQTGETVYIAGSYINQTTNSSGVWCLLLDKHTGKVLNGVRYEFRRSTGSPDVFVPEQLIVQNIPNGNTLIAFELKGSSVSFQSEFVSLFDVNFKLIGAPGLFDIPVSSTDVLSKVSGKTGSIAECVVHSGDGSVNFYSFDSLLNERAGFVQYLSPGNYAGLQFTLGGDGILRSILPQPAPVGLSFNLVDYLPSLTGIANDCFYERDTVMPARQPVVVSEYSSNWVASGFDLTTITLSKVRPGENTISTESLLCSSGSRCGSIRLTGTSDLCLNDSSYSFAALTNGECKSAIVWQADSSFFKMDGSDSGPVIKLKAVKAGVVYLHARLASCPLSDSFRITIHARPEIFLGKDTVICEKDQLVLAAGQFSDYAWQDGSSDPNFTVSDSGEYYVSVTDGCGLKASDTIAVHSRSCAIFFQMPNAFTPNQDGLNDVIRPLISGNIESYEFKIFNRLGQCVFNSANPSAAWSGNINGVPQPTGSFVWLCRYKLEGLPIEERKGTFLLIR
ncbi:MAG TPA: gliding motility-associated C-terminal domain-containing protein [Puia sp.]|nr:gliding motility-associated C-terminal domain-containing protein [Puia sp.]